MGLSIRLSIHPSYHRYNGAYMGGFRDTGYLPFFFQGYGINYLFTSMDMP